AGFNAAVDWPTASFYRELHEAFPDARFVLTYRDPDTWAESFSDTIYHSIAGRAAAPPQARDWLDMAADVIARAGFPMGLDRQQLAAAFTAHNDAVKAALPSEQLLVFQVKEGWSPLCDFLGVPTPEQPFPRRNDRAEFWQLVKGDSGVTE
ncbi:MAG: sulfotransferase, partial [Pseudomonadales bacterium]